LKLLAKALAGEQNVVMRRRHIISLLSAMFLRRFSFEIKHSQDKPFSQIHLDPVVAAMMVRARNMAVRSRCKELDITHLRAALESSAVEQSLGDGAVALSHSVRGVLQSAIEIAGGSAHVTIDQLRVALSEVQER
jgi:hypothetical protein